MSVLCEDPDFVCNCIMRYETETCGQMLMLMCLSTAQGVCMIVGGIKHREQKFNSRSAGVSSALLFISIGGMYGIWTYHSF